MLIQTVQREGASDRLLDLELSVEKFRKVVERCIGERRSAGKSHAKGAKGTLQYHEAIAALRQEFCGEEWISYEKDGTPGIENQGLGLRVLYSNVDRAGDIERPPQPNNPKGSKGSAVHDSNLQIGFTGDPSWEKPKTLDDNDWQIYTLMVDSTGSAELTKVVLENGLYSEYFERIFLPDFEQNLDDIHLDDGNDLVDDVEDETEIDISVTRKF